MSLLRGSRPDPEGESVLLRQDTLLLQYSESTCVRRCARTKSGNGNEIGRTTKSVSIQWWLAAKYIRGIDTGLAGGMFRRPRDRVGEESSARRDGAAGVEQKLGDIWNSVLKNLYIGREYHDRQRRHCVPALHRKYDSLHARSLPLSNPETDIIRTRGLWEQGNRCDAQRKNVPLALTMGLMMLPVSIATEEGYATKWLSGAALRANKNGNLVVSRHRGRGSGRRTQGAHRLLMQGKWLSVTNASRAF